VANTITWKPMLISGELLGVTQGANRNADKVERIINQVYYEDKTYTVNLKTIQLSATVQTATATLTVTDNDPAELVVASGSAVTISPTVTGSSKGVTVSAVEVSGGVETKANSVFDSLDGPQYVFRAPENKGTSEKIYKITVTAQENTDKKLTITIRVPGQDVTVAAGVKIAVGNGNMDSQDVGITTQSGDGTYEVLIPDLDLTNTAMSPITVKLSVVDGASSFALNSKSDVNCALYRSSAYNATSGFSQIGTDNLSVDYAGGVKVGITLTLGSVNDKGAYQLVLTSVEDPTKKFVLTVRVANVTEPSSSTE